MNTIDELIQKECPEGVEWKSLETFLKIMNGKDYKFLNNGPFPVYGTGGIMTYVDKYAYDKPSVLLPRKGSIEKIYYVDKPFWTVDTIYWTKIDDTIIVPKYLYYYISRINLASKNIGTGAIPSLTQSILYKIEIPIPPLSVQHKIVEILDKFTSLEAELQTKLQAELEARKKQYEYYRNQLLDFTGREDVEWKTLDSVSSKITDGSHFSPSSVDEGYYMPSVKDMTSNGFDFSSCKKISKEDYDILVRNGCKPKTNDVLIAKDGSMLKYVFPIFKEEDIVLLSSIAIVTPIHEIIDSTYLSHYLRQEKIAQETINKYSSKGGVPRIILKNFKKITIPIPPLTEQQRIVTILDKFEALINDQTASLAAEMKARHQQYEYYRDKLLTFQRKEA